jgi:hypothetical protein
MWVVSFWLLPLYSRGKISRYPLDRRLGGPQRPSARDGEVEMPWENTKTKYVREECYILGVTLYKLAELHHPYWGTSCFHLQGWKERYASKKSSMLCLFGLLFIIEDGSSMFHRNSHKFAWECVIKPPEAGTFFCHFRVNSQFTRGWENYCKDTILHLPRNGTEILVNSKQSARQEEGC